MQLFLMRHGSAFDIGERGVRTDAERMLTQEGRDCSATVLRRVSKVCKPQHIWTSPLVRARETAEIACEILVPSEPLSMLESLRSGEDPREVLNWLKTCTEDSLMLVGHLPDLAILATMLITRVEADGIILKKSGVCCIEFDGPLREGLGRLAWLVTPSLLERIE